MSEAECITGTLWAEKHQPKYLNSMLYHEERATDLQTMVDDGNPPHLLVHGISWDVPCNCLLGRFFDPPVPGP